jgi:hypothetical protein
VAHHQQPARVTTVRRDVLVHPAQRACDVAGDGAHLDRRQQAVADGDEDEAGIREGLRLEGDHGLVARLPAAAMNPEHDRRVLRPGRRVDIEHLAFVRRGVRDIAGDALRVRVRHARDRDEKEPQRRFHRGHYRR